MAGGVATGGGGGGGFTSATSAVGCGFFLLRFLGGAFFGGVGVAVVDVGVAPAAGLGLCFVVGEGLRTWAKGMVGVGVFFMVPFGLVGDGVAAVETE